MRIITVVMGEPDSDTRNKDVSSVFDYVYAQYGLQKIVDTDTVLEEVAVEKGKNEYVGIVAKEDITDLYNKNDGVDDIIDIKADKSGTNSYELEDMTLDQGRVVAKIEKKETNNEAKVVTKRINNKKVTKTAKNKSASEEKAKKIAESRKEAARIKREKMTSGEVELNEPNTPNQDGTVETDL